MQRKLFTLEDEDIKILAVYKRAGVAASKVVREALRKYYFFNKPKVAPGQYDGVDPIVEYD